MNEEQTLEFVPHEFSGELRVGNGDIGHSLMPVMDIAMAVARRQAIIDFTRSIMQEGTDYGRIPGTGDKPTLLKPGAEKLSTFFGLSPQFTLTDKVLDWTGEDHEGEPFFYFEYRCSLHRGDLLVGQGDGSCNSWERKYRYRTADRSCPYCGAETIKRSKFPPRHDPSAPPGWYCFEKIGGCGANFAHNDPVIQEQEAGRVPNDNPADLVNTIKKMAQKRALVAATLIAVNASEFFTQDIEDMDFGPVVDTKSAKDDVATARPEPNGKIDLHGNSFDQALQSARQFMPAALEATRFKTDDEVKKAMKKLGYTKIDGRPDRRVAQLKSLVSFDQLTGEGLPEELAIQVANGNMTREEAEGELAAQN